MDKILLNGPEAAIILSAFLALSIVADILLRGISATMDVRSSELFRLLSNSQRAVLVSVGLIMAISELGFDVSALVAGLGLSGFALGFALKDAISNLVAGAMIVVYKPCEIGDQIQIGAVKGEIVDVNLRYITVTEGADRWLIPNSVIVNSQVKIFGEKPEEPAETKTAPTKKNAPKRAARRTPKTKVAAKKTAAQRA